MSEAAQDPNAADLAKLERAVAAIATRPAENSRSVFEVRMTDTSAVLVLNVRNHETAREVEVAVDVDAARGAGEALRQHLHGPDGAMRRAIDALWEKLRREV